MLKQSVALLLCFTVITLLESSGIWAEQSQANISPRIINGTDAILNATRHQVSIRQRNQDFPFGKGHFCGGSLISPNVVLSAAHCFTQPFNNSFQPKENFIVVMGNLDRFEQNNNTLVFDIKNLISWADYFNTNKLDDDIALLVLNASVPEDHPTVSAITLNEGPVLNDTECQVTGWGVTEEKVTARKLKTVDVRYFELNECQNKTKYFSSIREGMVCAGYLKGEKDSCVADSGGPLVCNGLQVGIVSWGIECAKPFYPGVYTEVAFFKKWILRQLVYYDGILPKFNASIKTNGVSSLSCSIILISLMLMFKFLF